MPSTISVVGTFLVLTCSAVCQSSKLKPAKAEVVEQWDEQKLTARAQTPFISESGCLVLSYVITNNTNADITLDFTRPVFEKRPYDRAYFLLKDSNSFDEIQPDGLLDFSPKLIPSHLPVQVTVMIGSSAYRASRWFETDAEKLTRAIRDQLSRVSQIAIFLPDTHARLNLPVPPGR